MDQDEILLILRNTADELSFCGVKTEIKMHKVSQKKWQRKKHYFYLQISDQGQYYDLIYTRGRTVTLINHVNKNTLFEFTCTDTNHMLGVEILQVIKRKYRGNYL